MTVRSFLISWLDNNAASLIGTARYRFHVGIKGDVVYPKVTRILFRRLSSKRSSAIDVGANTGIFSRYLAEHFGQVTAVEPIPYLADRLKRGAPANVSVEAAALGSERGSITLRVPTDAFGNEMAALSTAANLNKLTFINKSGIVERQVAMKTLDEIADQSPGLAFVKIDVEGFEASVLAGAKRVLSQNRPLIQIEIGRAHNPEYATVLKVLEDAKYHVFALQKNGLYLDARQFIEAQPVAVDDREAASPHGCWDYLCVPTEQVETMTAGLIRQCAT